MNLHQVSAIVGGNFVGKEARIQGVTTDSRGDCKGKLFVALKGENFDGEAYCQAAVEKGAAAVLVANAVEVHVPQLIVKDTLVALQAMATAWVKQTGVKVIAITGSNGKTTVKNMLLSVLSQKYQCHATAGNFNNEIGVPLSVLGIRHSDEVAVIEMGAAQVGDIASLTEIIRPDIALVTNIGEAHVGRFGSVEKIAVGKAEIYQALNADGLAIINADSPYCEQFSADLEGRKITFGKHSTADFRLLEGDNGYQVLTRRNESFALKLPVLGLHNYINATAVVAIAVALQVSFTAIEIGLSTFEPEPGRLQVMDAANGLCVINDSYNANPASVKAAIDVLAEQHTPTLLVLGDMGELGEHAETLHQQVGEYAQHAGINQVIAVGEFAAAVCRGYQAIGGNAQSFKTVAELTVHLNQQAPVQGTVLVKGSRSMRLERVVESLTRGQVA